MSFEHLVKELEIHKVSFSQKLEWVSHAWPMPSPTVDFEHTILRPILMYMKTLFQQFITTNFLLLNVLFNMITSLKHVMAYSGRYMYTKSAPWHDLA